MSTMQHVDANIINVDLQARVDYLTKFIEFGPADAEALHGAAPIVKPLVGAAVDAVYEKLFSFDITRVTFMARNTGFTGKLAEKLEDINHNSEQIKFRKDFLKLWLVKIFTADYNDPKTFEYLDRVGVMHTGKAGFKHREKKDPLFVDYAHCAILLGYVQSMLTSAVTGRDDLPQEVKTATLLAINKVMWIQNDLFARHYIPSFASKAKAIPKAFGVDERVWPVLCGGLVVALAYLLWA
ncbi:protoglobin protein [Rhizoctonia solani AG-3 Rhs1AP]|uniref:Protoglobin protein n=1 Tax=Rhizoctonia solani AG-3 Rhs1AP TaxID=1086054 RepID=A0A0A1ULT0_9AGAM|nr:protoglobin protein [Rhizoctonia solani AG-3 Rhs1AP]